MTANEYALCYRGYFLRHNRSQEPFRELYRLLWNVNTGKGEKIRSNAQLYHHWPLLTDDRTVMLLDSASMSERWEKALALTRRLKENGKPDTRHNNN